MKKSVLLLLPLMLTLGACKTTPKTPDIPDTPDTPDWGETATYTVTFRGSKDRSGLGSGSQLGTNAFDSSLSALIEEQTDGALVSFGGQKCGTQLVGGDSATDTSLTIGTGSYAGKFYLKFSVDIVKIEVTVQNYYKAYTNGFSLDANAEVTMCSYDRTGDGTVLESKNVDLTTTETNTAPSERQESLEFENKTREIAFFNSADKHRTYIHSLTITYIVK